MNKGDRIINKKKTYKISLIGHNRSIHKTNPK